MTNRLIRYLPFGLCFIAGVSLDRIFVDFPYLKLNPQVSVIEVAGLFVTFTIAFMIPFSVNKLIEEKRGLKVFLIDDLKDLISIVKVVETTISDSHSRGDFSSDDRDFIVHTFNDAGLKIEIIKSQLEIIFKDEYKEYSDKLSELIISYDNYVTGGELMISSFVKVNEHFFLENKTRYASFEKELKKFILRIYIT